MASPDDDLQRWLAGLSYKLKRELAGKIRAEAERLRSAIEDAAPKKDGVLAGTVKVRRKRNELDLEVTAGGDDTLVEVRKGSGEKFDRALFPEFGTVHQPATPYFFPTYRRMAPEIRQNIDDAVADVISKA
jgi:HK97 gp10 family phage protein